MTPQVVVVGSVNLDLVVHVGHLPAAGETVIGGRFARSGGGKGANQALAAKRSGADVWLIAEVGDDEMASEALADLEEVGVDLAGVSRSTTAPTGVALIVVDQQGENMIAVASGANAELSPARVEEAMHRPPDGGVVVANFEIPDDALLAAAAAAARTGRTLLVNPAPARPLPDGLSAMGPMITPNRDEAAVLSGEDDPGRERSGTRCADRGRGGGDPGAPMVPSCSTRARQPRSRRHRWNRSTPPAPAMSSPGHWPPASPPASLRWRR